MTRIAVLGAGYVGLTTAACLAHFGHQVICTDVNEERIAALVNGVVPIVEAELPELVREGLSNGLLSFSTDNADAVHGVEFTFLCVPTPQSPSGRADMSYIEAAAREIGPHLARESIVVNKSTVPVGSTKVVERALRRPDVAVLSNPEFLREGSAVHDFLHPDRIVIGAESEASAVRLSALFLRLSAPVVVTDPASAETIKYAANAFLATKVSFINAVAALCEAVGADVRQVALGLGYDRRIGPEFLRPGPGWGGSCFPKDTAALIRIAEDAGYDFGLLAGVVAVNEEQHQRVVAKAVELAGGSVQDRVVGVLGLTFKAGTDDMRNSPAVEIVRHLIRLGAIVKAYDPTVREPVAGLDDVELCQDPYAACEGAVVMVLATEWDEFRWLDFDKVSGLMERPALMDCRNLLEGAMLRRFGFEYKAVGIP
ncbi:MAG: UDP-glucose/GDP-mannose dehydrogenase family protein [Actinomycetota bacterium]|nr:UDP-glucose/GDP-mannose dehydrogenase family protein [Actinomycetota bacterium]